MRRDEVSIKGALQLTDVDNVLAGFNAQCVVQGYGDHGIGQAGTIHDDPLH